MIKEMLKIARNTLALTAVTFVILYFIRGIDDKIEESVYEANTTLQEYCSGHGSGEGLSELQKRCL